MYVVIMEWDVYISRDGSNDLLKTVIIHYGINAHLRQDLKIYILVSRLHVINMFLELSKNSTKDSRDHGKVDCLIRCLD